MKRISLAVYAMVLSLIVILSMVGWIVRENRAHQDELAEAVVLRGAAVNEFLRTEVCERLGVRDEINSPTFRPPTTDTRKPTPTTRWCSRTPSRPLSLLDVAASKSSPTQEANRWTSST